MKNVNRIQQLAAVALAAALTAACGSIGLPDILGGGGDGDTRTSGDVTTVRGTVERVDVSARQIVIDGDATYNLRNGGGDTLVLDYDSGTSVVFEGRSYDPADLERGDRIVAEVDDTGNRLVAERIEVTHDVTGGVGSVDDDDRWATDLRGTVRSIDTYARTIQLDRSGYASSFTTYPGGAPAGDVVTVYYDADTVVEYQGRFYGPDSLERGDVVDVEVMENGSRLMAEEISLVRDVRASR